MSKIKFHRKRPLASNDYEIAYNVILNLETGKNCDVQTENLPAFRKYAYDLAAKSGKNIATRKINNSLLRIYVL